MNTIVVPLRRGGSVAVDEPAWCVAGHSRPVDALADIAHEGPELLLTVATTGGPVDILAAALDQTPYATSGDRLPRGSVDLGPAGWVPMVPGQLRQLADGLTAHAEQIRRLAAVVEQLRAAGEVTGP